MSGPPPEDLARDLGEAWDNATIVRAPTVQNASLTTDDAYRIQELIISERMKAGRRRAGWKLGLTTAEPPVTPIVGTLLSDMVVPSGADLALGTMVAPMVEAELVVRIGETIVDGRTADELRHGPHEIGPGIEVIDYRTIDSAGAIDWIADNSTVAYAVVGDLVPVGEIDAAEIETSLVSGDRFLASGIGRKVMGDPLAAAAWLSDHLATRGRPLERGHVVLTGSLTGHHVVARDRNSEFVADFDALGTVSVRFHR